MRSRTLPLGILLMFAVGQPAFATDAAARYEADKKLCAEESNSSTRMQCLRDARAEYDKALAASKGTTATAGKCAGCGKVVSVTKTEKKGEGGALGVIGGGVAGALLGNQVGSGTGRTVATVAGAAGGAYAGHKVEEKLRSTTVWDVKVKFDNGKEQTLEVDHDPGLAAGDLVKVSNGKITRR
jgi:outer membrane lipoprotein SlyB